MPPAERKDGVKRRDGILDAALACFLDRGVLATGIEDIRKAAGASPSSVYHYFDDGIAGITLALLTRTFERLFAHLASQVTKTKSAEDAVVALVRGHIDWILEHRDEGKFMYQAMSLELASDQAKKLAIAKAVLLQPVVDHLGTFIARGELPRWSPVVFDVVLLGTSHESCRRFLAGADLDAKWMRTTLPRLAWTTVAAELPKKPKARRKQG